MSLVCMAVCKGSRLLFTGDIENARMKQMLKDPYDLSCDWIKIPHHGKHDKKLNKLLEAAGPGYAVVSTSEDVLDDDLLEALEDLEPDVFYTFKGDVKTTCTGKGLTVSYLSGP